MDELEPSRENFRNCKRTLRRACIIENCRALRGRNTRKHCKKQCKKEAKAECLYLKPTRKVKKKKGPAAYARVKNSSETTDGTDLKKSNNENVDFKFKNIATTMILVLQIITLI